MTETVRVAAALITDDTGRVLLVRKRGTAVFMQPGGTFEGDETAAVALCRELEEEVGVVVEPRELHHLGRYSADAVDEPGATVVTTVFQVWLEDPVKPGGEIEELRWVHPDDFGKLEVAPLLTEHMLQHLGNGGPPRPAAQPSPRSRRTPRRSRHHGSGPNSARPVRMAVSRARNVAALLAGVSLVVGLVIVAVGGPIDENPLAIVALLAVPAFIPALLLAAVGVTLDYFWVTEHQRWIRSATPGSIAGRVAGSILIVGGAVVLAPVLILPLTSFSTELDRWFAEINYLAVLAIVFFAFITLTGIVGAVIMGGRGAAIVGVLFGVGFAALIYGLVESDGLWILLGMAAFVGSVFGFTLIGVLTGWLPPAQAAVFGHWLSVLAATVAITVWLVVGDTVSGLLGTSLIASWSAVRLGILIHRRRAPDAGG